MATLDPERRRMQENIRNMTDNSDMGAEKPAEFHQNDADVQSLRVWKVFVASPKDVARERQQVEEVVNELNDGEAHLLDTHIELLDWRSKVVPLMGRPEQVILEQLLLEDTDLLILILWHRLGTPSGGKDPHTGRPFDSGTEEEFTLAYELWKKQGRPQIVVYHCTRAIDPRQVIGEQLAKLQGFLKGFEASGQHPGMVQEYETVRDFRRRLRRDLVTLLYAMWQKEKAGDEAVAQPSTQPVTENVEPTQRSLTVHTPEAPQGPDAPITVQIPAGSFWMGSSSDDIEAGDNEKPRRAFYLPCYQIGRYPVTNAEYAQFVLGAGSSPPEHWNQKQVPSGLEDHPVVNVSLEDAVAYCEWLSRITQECFRLPTEEEWEKAARGGMPEAGRYPWGDGWRPGYCNTAELGRGVTSSVREFEQVSQSPFGVVDMVGNVWEWTSSWYEPYPGSAYQSDKYGQVCRVVRGGSFRNSHQQARISCRGRYEPGVQRAWLGFRVVLEEALEDTDRARIRQNLDVFSREELGAICQELGIGYEDLPDTKDDLTGEMVARCEKAGKMVRLLAACHQRRPEVTW